MAAEPIRFDGRVVLVTGAGNGLGRQYALAFAERGASVVVNDLGGDTKGEGKSGRAADKVVQEIRAKGGKAVADYNSVEQGDQVVETAIKAFGRIDVVVNNAGILRDKSILRMSELDWDLVQRVHLKGSFLVTRAAWPHMKKQKFGRIIMTTSTSGIYGNFGQANYSAAKLGLVGLSNTLAQEGAKYNIKCNAIAPVAGSRLTKTVMSDEMIEALKPEYIAPLVLYLCHESCEENAGLFETAVGWFSQTRWQRTKGKLLRKEVEFVTPEMVRDNWEGITDWTDAENPTEASNVLQFVEDVKEARQEQENARNASPGKSMTQKMPDAKKSYTHNDVILYALGVGVSFQEDYSHLKFLYENHEDFAALPTFGIILGQGSMMGIAGGEMAGIKFDPAKLLHGEQYLEVYKPLPTSGSITNRAEVVDVLDKGKGALVLLNVTTLDEQEEPICFNQFSIYLGGAGGFGGKRSSDKVKPVVSPPSRTPDASVKEKTGLTQAALYRLSGDYNPLHVDPAFAQMGGLSKPILHGLCSLGYSARHVLKQYANNDVSKFKALKVRFSKPVVPGQTIQTDMWKEGSRVHFQSKVVENGTVVISGAYVDFTELTPNIPPSSSGLKSEALFAELKKRVSDHPDLVKKVKGIFLWHVKKGGKVVSSWTVDLKTPGGAVFTGPPKGGKPDTTITCEDEDLISMATGKANPQQLFMKGKLKVAGNIMLTMKLNQLFKDYAKI
ncbi:predicted protein [Nematostella vectensis]|uniref:Peroxisomal multifunctional enzyme type 2 n=1 Tax=Nematostella vectensis TaxID=45351 RepID=A7STV7_NEMVE|nr:predicted protein [Nematostella vectensis]|eukprot:XP_001624936.1 predicted protein [Nematostella vectensis]